MILGLVRSAPAFDIIQGTVAARDRQPTGGYIARGDTDALLTTEPEIWLKDAAAQEHHFRGHQFDNAREGHAVIIITKRGDGKVLRVRNLSAKTSIDSGELAPPKSGLVASTIGLAALLLVPAFIAWLAVAIGLREMLLGVGRNGEIDIGWHFRAFLIVLLSCCVFLALKIRAIKDATATTLSANIDAAIAKAIG